MIVVDLICDRPGHVILYRWLPNRLYVESAMVQIKRREIDAGRANRQGIELHQILSILAEVDNVVVQPTCVADDCPTEG